VQIKEQRHGAVTVLTPQGPLCQADAEAFEEKAKQTLDRTMGRLVVDMSGSPYVDSRGLEALLAVTEQLAQSGRVLKVCNAAETVREILELTDLASMFEHYADANAAVRSFL
jgi:anti-anti-sigma factor